MKDKKKCLGFIIVVIIVMLAVAAGILAYNNSDSVRLKRQLDLGNRYLAELNYEEAIVAYEAAIEIEPMSVEAYLGLAEAYIGKGDYEAAAEALQKGYELTGDEGLKQKLDEVNKEIVRLKEEEAKRKEEERKKAAEDAWKSQFDLIVEAGDGIHCFRRITCTAEEESVLDAFLEACAAGDMESVFENSLDPVFYNDSDEKKFVGALYKDYAIEMNAVEDNGAGRAVSCGNIYNLNDGMGFSFYIQEGNGRIIWYFYQIPCAGGKFQGDFAGRYGVEGLSVDDDSETKMEGYIEGNLVITGNLTVSFTDGCEALLTKVENNIFTINHNGYNHRTTGTSNNPQHEQLTLYEESDLGEKVHLSMGYMCAVNEYSTYENVYEAIPVD